MTRVKICGNRDHSDVAHAVAAGADAVGVLVGQRHPSDDFVDVDRARAIFAALPPFVAGVLVTHRDELDAVVELVERSGCSTLQLHAEVEPERADRVRESIAPVKLIALVSVRDDSAVQRARLLAPAADALILDSFDEAAGRVGGTGQSHDWAISARIVAEVESPVVLAGGLEASNVIEAIQAVRPWAVDVNSGVRGPDGMRSEDRLREFLARAQDC